MNFERFQSIIQYNQEHQNELQKAIRKFYREIGMEQSTGIGDIMKIVRPCFRRKGYLLLEMPFKDQEIGALCYKGDVIGYTFLNSSLPKANNHFALCHEIYHIFCQDNSFEHGIELYMDEHYYEHVEEMNANLFAGMLLMPEITFSSMFQRFQREMTEEDSELSIVVKLMNYYEAPYMAVLIRCYELQLLQDGATLQMLIEADGSCIEKEFERMWLNEELLRPTGRDDFPKLKEMVIKTGEEYREEGIVSEKKLQKVLQKMTKIYKEIGGTADGEKL